MDEALRKQTQLQRALKQRDVRVASLIVEGFHNSTELLDEQQPAVLEVLIEYVNDLVKNDSAATKRRTILRAALSDYARQALIEAREREDRLYHAITGRPEEE
jgi:hypothetical protein